MAASFEYTSDEIVAIIDNDEGGYDAKISAFEEATDAGGDSFAVRELRDALSDLATRAAEAAGLDYTASDVKDAVKEMIAEWRDVSGNKKAAEPKMSWGQRRRATINRNRPTKRGPKHEGRLARVRRLGLSEKRNPKTKPPSLRFMIESGEGWDSVFPYGKGIRHRLRLRPEHLGMRLSKSMGVVSRNDIGRELVVDRNPSNGRMVDVITD